ncbi:SRPBCC family protein [Chitinibacter sp. GC72]|uniref:SRPBCC family protein n=1 Tax=Chitinibacter sp. GC72 TaxID=1526917 RepID=UPI0012FCCEE2|nr:SRPBCC family protein [Chitinibacter sp. GC72]
MTTTGEQFDPQLDLAFEREVPLPPEAIWAAWTQPEHLVHWFTPAPWRTTECQIDLRPGGLFHTEMKGPEEGQQFSGVGCYLDIIPQRRLVWTNALLPGFRPNPSFADSSCGDFPFTATIELTPIPGGTRYKAIVTHRDADGRAQHAAMGFEEGWGKALEQLVAHMQAA